NGTGCRSVDRTAGRDADLTSTREKYRTANWQNCRGGDRTPTNRLAKTVEVETKLPQIDWRKLPRWRRNSHKSVGESAGTYRKRTPTKRLAKLSKREHKGTTKSEKQQDRSTI
ncbi:hypothetical protein PIB30_082690, partial [Stylosanthes scabra]|nr:hypothetical protein [Stylosanthes scabra]